jgi:hypothetical protein
VGQWTLVGVWRMSGHSCFCHCVLLVAGFTQALLEPQQDVPFFLSRRAACACNLLPRGHTHACPHCAVPATGRHGS